MFEALFADLPLGVRRILEKRLETLVLSIDEDKVPDIKAIINLAHSMRRDINQLKKRDLT